MVNRIAHIAWRYPPHVGGMETHIQKLSQAQRSLSNETHIITPETEGASDPDKENSVHRVHVNDHRFLTVPTFAHRIRRMCGEIRPDVVHAHGLYPAGAATLLGLAGKGTPLVCTVHSSQFLNDRNNSKLRLYFKAILRNSDAVIGVSDELLEVANDIEDCKDKSKFISNGVEEKFFEVDSTLDGSPQILCPRRFVRKNGVQYLADAVPDVCEKNQNVSIRFVGGGEMAETLESKTSDFHDYVSVSGSVPHDEMPQVFSESNIVVIPSLKEATSIATLEAMAAGRAIVATKVGGLPQLITHEENGLLVDPASPEELAKEINRLCNDDSLRSRLGENARRTARNFSWTSIARQTINVYDEVISRDR